MKLSDIPAKELWELLEKTEEESEDWLYDKGLICYVMSGTIAKHDSPLCACCLADLSERLWKQAVENCSLLLFESIKDVFYSSAKWTVKHTTEFIERWALYESKSIHRIIAALLALKGAGKEVE